MTREHFTQASSTTLYTISSCVELTSMTWSQITCYDVVSSMLHPAKT